MPRRERVVGPGLAIRYWLYAYRMCLSSFEPLDTVQAPVHHLHANKLISPIPPGMSCDWKHLATGSYRQYHVLGTHHHLLDAAHILHVAAVLREVLRDVLPILKTDS